MARPVDNYETACDFVKIDVSIQDKISGQTKLSQFCNTVAQHQNQYEHAGEIETLSCKKAIAYQLFVCQFIILYSPDCSVRGLKIALPLEIVYTLYLMPWLISPSSLY